MEMVQKKLVIEIINNINSHLLKGDELKDYHKTIYSDLKNTFNELSIFISKHVYWRDYIYYGRNENDLCICYDEKNTKIWLNIVVWKVFQFKHNLSHESVKTLTTWYLNKVLNISGNTCWKDEESFLNVIRNGSLNKIP